MRAGTGVAGIMVALLMVPAAAQAATIHGEGGTLTYTAAAGHDNHVQLMQTGDDQVQVVNRDGDPITASGTCGDSPWTPGLALSCDGITNVVADGGDGNDEISSWIAALPTRLLGSAGNDWIYSGMGAETLDGGDGDDELVSQQGAGSFTYFPTAGDTIVGGPGVDTARISIDADPPPALAVSLDDLPNDGAAENEANVRSDVENVFARSNADNVTFEPKAAVTITGSAANNTLTGDGPLTIAGGDGSDILQGAAFDDALDSHDTFADTVTCGGGTDAAKADELDAVAPDCETVTYEPRVVPPAVTLAVKARRRARFTVSGAVARRANVTQQHACTEGVVAITAKAGRRKVARKRAALTASCTFKRRLSVRRKLGRRVLRFTARFKGNAVMTPKASEAVRVHAAR